MLVKLDTKQLKNLGKKLIKLQSKKMASPFSQEDSIFACKFLLAFLHPLFVRKKRQ